MCKNNIKEINCENGNMNCDYDRKFWQLKRADEILKRINTTKQINAESKGFIEKMENEIKKKY